MRGGVRIEGLLIRLFKVEGIPLSVQRLVCVHKFTTFTNSVAVHYA